MRKILKLNIFHLVEKIVRFLVDCGPQIRIALFTNMRILKFRSQPTIAFFAAVNHLNGPLRKQNFTSRVQKVMVCDLWISIRFVCFSVSRFVACDCMIDGSDKHNCEGGFWTLEFVCLWKAQLSLRAVSEAPGSGGINGQLNVCFSILLVFIQYNISVQCKSAQSVAFMLVERQQFLEFPVTSN